ncbi:hypothetical protein Dsin_004171 [Dipteronia sinensis]|uniref:Protein kinase domain-containing protein n=1 Tax=Dipteronia sinensis TaxID=43782 RepID=A0AAE0BA99_9ROSI|nr:hypothetical protein Dsin_004171 [Dipteronia sinensis]
MVIVIRSSKLQLWVAFVYSIMCVSIAFNPEDNYLIDCGSTKNTSVNNRVFLADSAVNSNDPLTPENILTNASLNSMPTNYSDLYNSARVFTGVSNYSFSIKKQGRHWIRLHFFDFNHPKFNLSNAKFSVSTQKFTLIKEFKPKSSGGGSGSGSFVREYCLEIDSDRLVVTFSPFANSFAFVNALEVVSIPGELIPQRAETTPHEGFQSLQKQALETVVRVNMGNESVSPQRDLLSRSWVSDDAYLRHNVLPKFVSNVSAVNFNGTNVTDVFAPADVYGTASVLNSEHDPHTNVNITWIFEVDPGFQHLVRFHFCDIVSRAPDLIFNIYINSWIASRYFDLRVHTSHIPGAPYYMDFIVRKSDSNQLNVSIGPADLTEVYPTAILNGLEIMKINNSRGSLDVLDTFSSKSSKMKVGFIVGIAIASFIIVVSVLVLFLLYIRRRKLAHIAHLKAEDNEVAMFSSSKIGYRFPFVAIQEATGHFNESFVIGVGGFGKVYKGVLRDETKVAVKRGGSQSHQGRAEFRTEIEMLSQFRHRHLVSLIGYCDERDEMIIIYEYMENGTLKDHLYGTNLPCLSWRQRLEVCIGSARGLHYLHTGPTKAIIHRDVKSANILLDENFMAKVADFGLSKTGPDLDQTHVSTMVKGSFGYLDPEYLTRQQLTEKSDVYSFGVVMLEVLCGRPVIDPSLPREKVNLIEWVMRYQTRGRLEDIVDPNIINEIKTESLKKFRDIAEKCLAECGLDRPTMGDVLWNLECALQLQGNEEKSSSSNGDMFSQVTLSDHSHSQTSVSTTQFSVGDLAGASMSKVFAQMVREDTREM